MKFKIIFVASIVFFWSISFTIAAQFEDYKWGSSVSQTKQLLRKKGKNFIVIKNGIGYEDKIMEEKCKVMLFFTPKSKKLAGIGIIWNTTYVGDKVKRILEKKYGKPIQPNEFMDRYFWGSPAEIILDYAILETELCYYSKEYFPLYRKEEEEIESKESNRFSVLFEGILHSFTKLHPLLYV